jgi:two-component system CheB/CheR fusion protein
MLNFQLSEVIGVEFKSFVAAEDKETLSLLIQQGWQSECKGETCLVNKNKEDLPFLISLTTLELDEGTSLSIIVTDLSVQKKNEKQLRLKNEQLQQAHHSLAQLYNELEDRVKERTHELSLSREHFKFLADNIPVIVWTSKPNGDLDYYNKRWYDYTGTSPNETSDWGWQKAIHPDDLQGTIDAWAKSITSGYYFHVEHRLLRASDGVYRWHSGTALPFKNDEDEIIAWFGISTDIDEQKKAMNRKDDFISMVSHELKTPVTTLKAFTQILLFILQKENHIKGEDYLLRMDKQINKLTSLIADLLDATKVNAGVMLFEEASLDFNELLIDVVDQMRLISGTHTIELNISESQTVVGDKNRLGQVMINLISNAIKYSPYADRIIVTADSKNQSLQLCVQDFGIGIPVDQQYQLFNRFFRASDVKTSAFPGLGLGLYISNEIVKRHSGSLTFKSELGKGSTFKVELPIAVTVS